MKKTTETGSMANKRHVKIGDLVTVEVAGGRFKGIVAEDRGPIGVGGRRLYGIVEIDVDPTALELPEEEFSQVAIFGSQQYLNELYEAIVAAAARSNADVVVSYYGRGDVQVRGHSMLPNIPERFRIVEEIDRILSDDSQSSSGRVIRRDRNPPGQQSKQNWYMVREG